MPPKPARRGVLVAEVHGQGVAVRGWQARDLITVVGGDARWSTPMRAFWMAAHRLPDLVAAAERVGLTVEVVESGEHR